MYNVIVFGAGKIGEAICALLTESGRYRVHVADHNKAAAEAISKKSPGTTYSILDLTNFDDVCNLLKGTSAVISALPYFCNIQVARAAKEAGVHYFDLTEDVKTTKGIAEIAEGAKTCFMPQCGIAPGFISIAASYLMRSFDEIETTKMRVGALPVYPSNRLKYNLTWSTDGLINEYLNPCEAIENGSMTLLPPLQGLETFTLDGIDYEAFNTSGGLGSLCETYLGSVKNLNYKTIRYPGHRDLMAFLIIDLKFNQHQSQLKDILERAIPTTSQDKCVIFVEVTGTRDGKFTQRTYASEVYGSFISGEHYSAIQITTAAGVCAPVDLLLTGKISGPGMIKPEDILLDQFMENEFGEWYIDDKALAGLA